MITIVTVLAFMAVLLTGLIWALMPMLAPPQGLHPTNWTAADLILDRCKFCVINPRHIIAKDDLDVHFLWAMAEIKARALIVALPWAFAVGAVIWRKRKKRKANHASNRTVNPGGFTSG